MQRVAVYCGSRPGNSEKYAQAAATVATALAQRNIAIVYGGSKTGLMGAVAAGDDVIGVIPDALHKREVAHPGLTELHHVSSMHQRKAMMADPADAFIALPGGVGTLDEMIDIWCWASMGAHSKPCLCYDVDNYWQPLFDLLTHVRQEGFAHGDEQLLQASSPQQLLQHLGL